MPCLVSGGCRDSSWRSMIRDRLKWWPPMKGRHLSPKRRTATSLTLNWRAIWFPADFQLNQSDWIDETMMRPGWNQGKYLRCFGYSVLFMVQFRICAIIPITIPWLHRLRTRIASGRFWRPRRAWNRASSLLLKKGGDEAVYGCVNPGERHFRVPKVLENTFFAHQNWLVVWNISYFSIRWVIIIPIESYVSEG